MGPATWQQNAASIPIGLVARCPRTHPSPPPLAETLRQQETDEMNTGGRMIDDMKSLVRLFAPRCADRHTMDELERMLGNEEQWRRSIIPEGFRQPADQK
jgi:hypothetical protein